MAEHFFEQLETLIAERLQQSPQSSYVACLHDKGLDSILKKIGEEATEVVIAAKDRNDANNEQLIYEACDLIFHLMVLFGHKHIKISTVIAELQRRMGTSGLAEKAAR